MKINVRDLDVNYIQYGSGNDVVLLHGWGQNIQMMDPVGKKIKNHRITIIDLPGFGESEEPKFEYTMYDYNELLEELFAKLKINNPILIGHSFGGRLSIIYASKNKTEKLVLFGSPSIVKEKKPSLKVKILKAMKKVPVVNKLEGFAKKHIGSYDYRHASDMMRKILVNTVNQDLTKELTKIDCPTLLIWGENDTEVPLEVAQEMEKIINDAGLITFEGGSHYAYLENLDRVSSILKNFIGE